MKFVKILMFITLTWSLLFAQPQRRFPKPDFESGYQQPSLILPNADAAVWQTIDIILLFIALSLASYFALRTRSRKHMFILMLLSLLYFGFIRQGCICAVGSVQNVVYAFSHPNYAIPVVVIAFFALPLIFALFFGRTFCAAVCPLGAIQDAVVIKPVSVPSWLNSVLGFFPYIYLGLALLFAATGAGFIICQYDPFVGIFRFGGPLNIMILGGSLLLLGTIVARPYCRYICPYAVLLNWMSRLSRKHVTITPNECIQCHLCSNSCPFDAIEKPQEPAKTESKKSGARRLGFLALLLPVFMLLGGFAVSSMHVPLSKQHFKVALAERIQLEDKGLADGTIDETDAFRATGTPKTELFSEAAAIRHQFKTGGWILGAFLGLMFGLHLLGFSIHKRQIDYEPNRGTCLSCARCIDYCPKEHEKREQNV